VFARRSNSAGGMNRYKNAARWLFWIAVGAAVVAVVMSLHFDMKLQLAVILVLLIDFIALDIATSNR
jgi:hypothetical protein